MPRREVQQRWPTPVLSFDGSTPDYYRELRGHWLHCAHQARKAAIVATVLGDELKARKMRTDMRVAVLHARRVNRELVRILAWAHTRRA